MKESELKALINEVLQNTTQYALGYRSGQKDYQTDSKERDLTSNTEDFKNGYDKGRRDAKWGRVSQKVTRFLSSIGQTLGMYNIGNRN